jgi:predicted permease
MIAWLRRLFAYVRRRDLDAELADEIRLHIELRRQALVESGMDPRDAEHEARRLFGNPTVIRERASGTWRFQWLTSFAQDVRFAVRMTRRAPGYSAIVVATIALGAGLNGAIVVLFNAALLRPPDVARPHDVVRVDDGSPIVGLTYPDYVDYRDRAADAIVLAAFSSVRVTANIDPSGDRRTEDATAVLASGNFFDAVGVPPLLGRTFTGRDDLPPLGTSVVVLGEAYWTRRFNRDPGVIGRTIDLNYQPFTIVGIVPAWFRGVDVLGGGFPTVREMYVPLWTLPVLRPGSTRFHERTAWWGMQSVGRLRAGVTIQQARAQMAAAAAALDQEYPGQRLPRAPWLGRVTELDVRLFTTEAGLVASVLGAATLLVLVIACANVANLALARACTRSREIAVRLSLGAGRWRIVRQFLTESLVLSAGGTIAGFTLAYWVLRAWTATLGDQPFALTLEPDLRIASYAAFVAVLVAVVTGMVPALQASRPGILPALKDVAGTYRLGRLRSLFIGAEVAICLVLLVTTALMLRSAQRAGTIDPVMPAANLLTVASGNSTLLGYRGAKQAALVAELRRRLEAVSGITDTAVVNPAPFSGHRYGTTLRPADAADAPGIRVYLSNVSPDFFEVASLRIVRGRTFVPGAQDEVVVSQSLAERLWGSGDPLGRRLLSGEFNRSSHVVVGVAQDSPFVSLQLRNQPFMFWPIEPSSGGTIVARTAGPAAALIRPAQSAVREIDARLSPAIASLDSGIGEEIGVVLGGAGVAGALGALALVLSLFGVGAVTAHAVAQRTHEIGVRMALGAAPSDATALVVRQSIRPVVAGALVGLLAAAVVSRIAAAQMYGLSSLDPLAFGSAGGFLLVASIASAWLPARRAARVDPLIALRAE